LKWKSAGIRSFRQLTGPEKARKLVRSVTNMATAFATLFNKKVGCPSSQDLLAYDQACLASAHSLRIEAHLADCDFCNAELQLLNRYQNTPDEYSFAEMPSQLRGLAERLLHSTAAPFHALRRLEENRGT
jgi:hypothetical protein